MVDRNPLLDRASHMYLRVQGLFLEIPSTSPSVDSLPSWQTGARDQTERSAGSPSHIAEGGPHVRCPKTTMTAGASPGLGLGNATLHSCTWQIISLEDRQDRMRSHASGDLSGEDLGMDVYAFTDTL